jgi:4a-hydroxytetrahydrobiopterin dehydratase
MAKLSGAEIDQRLKQLNGWELKDNAIRKLYRFKEFLDGIRFVDRVAEAAEKMDHHPDILINYTRVMMACSTHSEGGVTEKDFALAQAIEKAFDASAGS